MSLNDRYQILILWIDRFLVFDLFLVILGSIWFFLAIFAKAQGISFPLLTFQKLWYPLFIPAITFLITGALISGLFAWLNQKGLDLRKDSET